MTDPEIQRCCYLSMEDDQNESWMMYDISRHMRRLVDRRAQALGLTRAQWTALSIIRRNQGVRQTDLAELLEVEPMTLARLLDRLQANGWIERREDPSDRRAKRIHLTCDVQPMLEQMRILILDLRREVFAGFSEEDHAHLVESLRRIKAGFVKCSEAAKP